MEDLMTGFQEDMSLYNCIRIVYDPNNEREDDIFFVCDTRIACFSSPGGIHSFKHQLGKTFPTVWTAPSWDHHDITRYNEDKSDQKLLEPDDNSLDVFYIICKNKPGVSMDHIEDTVKSSIVAARFSKDSENMRNTSAKGKGKAKGKVMTQGSGVSDDGSVKTYLVQIILPYICNLCKNPSNTSGPDKVGEENTAFMYVSEASVL